MRPLAALAAGSLLLWSLSAPGGLFAQEGEAPATARPGGGAGGGSGAAEIRILDVPFLPQEEDLCGGAATAMVLRHWGLRTAEATDFVGLVERDRGGIVADRLVAEVRRRGWNVAAASATPDELAGHVLAGRPTVILLRSGPDAFHYVTVVGVAGADFVVHDPARNPFRVLPREELRRRWAPSGGWAMLMWPARDTTSGDGGSDADAGASGANAEAPDPGPGAPDAAAAGGPDDSASAAGCEGLVTMGVREARRGDHDAAGRLLELALTRCPSDPAPHRELAGLAVRREAWGRAGVRARAALARAPDDPLSLRLLASSLYARDSARRALAVWNRLGEPRISGLRAYGLDRTRFDVLHRHLALERGDLLTPAGLTLVRRRALALPALSHARPGYRPPSSGASDVTVAVHDRPLLPSPPALVVGNALAAVIDREARVALHGPARAGDRLSLSGRWQEPRARLGAGYATTGAAGVAGIWEVGIEWTRQTFVPAGEAVPSADGAGPGGTSGVREEALSGRLSYRRWVTPSLRAGASVGYDRWLRAGEGPVVEASVEWRDPEGRLAVRGGTGARWGLSDVPVTGLEGEVRVRSAVPGTGLTLRARAGGSAVGAGAPRSVWPGAGTGRARDVLLRAHPLLEDGVLTGSVFGRRLLHGGVEIESRSADVGPLGLSGTLFLDGAAAWKRPGGGEGGRTEVDLGAGLRLDVPFTPRGLRLDAAVGLRDGSTALSLGWTSPWPGRE